MAYPFPSFASFNFYRDEWPLPGTDVPWNREPSMSSHRPLGSATDNVVTTSLGSRIRSFESLLTPQRFAQLELLVQSAGVFTGWERPVPISYQAFLVNIEALENLPVLCNDGSTQRRIRTRLNFSTARIVT